MELGSKIKALRLRAGITQEMLAEELGVSFQTISKWENGICAPDIMMLPKLSVYFGVTIDELFDLTAEQKLRRISSILQSRILQRIFIEFMLTPSFLRSRCNKDLLILYFCVKSYWVTPLAFIVTHNLSYLIIKFTFSRCKKHDTIFK